MPARWDLSLEAKVADAISDEDRAHYNETGLIGNPQGYHGLDFWAPNINIFRDPRWGRGQETYGEDPYLTAQFGVTFVKGLQGNDPKYFKVIATPKHFAVHSGPEPERHRINIVVSNYDLYDTYLPAFQAAITKGHAQSIMGAYSALDGTPDCASPLLLQTNLRDRWGFNGYVVSDCDAVVRHLQRPPLHRQPAGGGGRRRQGGGRPGLRRLLQQPARCRQAGPDHRGAD